MLIYCAVRADLMAQRQCHATFILHGAKLSSFVQYTLYRTTDQVKVVDPDLNCMLCFTFGLCNKLFLLG